MEEITLNNGVSDNLRNILFPQTIEGIIDNDFIHCRGCAKEPALRAGIPVRLGTNAIALSSCIPARWQIGTNRLFLVLVDNLENTH